MEPINERTETSSGANSNLAPEVRFKCPSCQKPYVTDMNAFNIVERVGRRRAIFECFGCKTQFAANLVAEGMAETQILPKRVNPSRGETYEPVAVRRAPVREPRAMVSCPKCSTENPKNSTECQSCGIVFAKFRGEAEETRLAGEMQLAGRPELVAMWNDVVAEYRDLAVHEKFVEACRAAGCLPFASYKYGRILEAAPGEEIAQQMRNRIVALVSHPFERHIRHSLNIRMPGFSGLAILLASAVTTMGLMLGNMHNLTGIGASMLALTLGMRFMLRHEG